MKLGAFVTSDPRYGGSPYETLVLKALRTENEVLAVNCRLRANGDSATDHPPDQGEFSRLIHGLVDSQ